jgi:hypothetical protein
MDLSATSLYHLRADQLRKECTERGLIASGSVQLLRHRLREFLDKIEMGGPELVNQEQASAPVDSGGLNTTLPNVFVEDNSNDNQAVMGRNNTPVLLELIKQVPPLLSERPEEILKFFVRVDDIYRLTLTEDRTFVTRLLPLVPAGLLQFLGSCIRHGDTWALCKVKVLEEFFPHFIRERLIRELIVFNFHCEEEPIRAYFDRVFQAAEFLLYEATEEQLVQRILMNLHPNIQKLACLTDRPRSRKDLTHLVSLIEEQSSILSERSKMGQIAHDARNTSRRGPPADSLRGNRPEIRRPVKCWRCGELGHVRSNCPRERQVSSY